MNAVGVILVSRLKVRSNVRTSRNPTEYATRVMLWLAERISSSVGKHVIQLGNGQVVRMTVSVGFACFPFIRAFPDAVNWEQVLQFSDSAMYEAKQQRDGWVGFLSTETTIAQEGVLRMIQETPDQLVREGIIEIRRSAPKAPLQTQTGESSSLATSADAG